MLQCRQEYQYSGSHSLGSIRSKRQMGVRWQVGPSGSTVKRLFLMLCAMLTIVGIEIGRAPDLHADNYVSQVVPVPLMGIQQISAGSYFTCILTIDGGVMCWGSNYAGKLGNGSNQIYSLVPIMVDGLHQGVKRISLGNSHACALTLEGAVKCWGENFSGQLGDGTYENSAVPVDVVGLSSGAKEIVAGSKHTCALTNNGDVQCWGNDLYGQLGNGDLSSSPVPTDVIGLAGNVISIDADIHTCALTVERGVKCWGYNFYGQVGDGTKINRENPVDVIGLPTDVAEIAVGGVHTCVLLQNGGVKCWGFNEHGELGNGTQNNSSVSVDVIGMTVDVSTISAGIYHTCGRLYNGEVKCWGENLFGQLGNGTQLEQVVATKVVDLPRETINITTGVSHTCSLSSGGRAKCWGFNVYGEVGDGTTQMRLMPMDVLSSFKYYVPFMSK